MRSSIRT